MTKVFVTGANGFIGSHLVRKLLEKGYQVNRLVRHTSDLSSLDGLKVKFIPDADSRLWQWRKKNQMNLKTINERVNL